MGTPEIISGLSLLVAVIVLLRNWHKDGRTEASTQAIMTIKLDSIQVGVDDIRVDQRAMRDQVNALGERMAKVEAKASSAHNRMDEHINMHPPDKGGTHS